MLAREEPTRPSGITGIGVEGFKSLREPQEIAIAPLTVLAGVNSSGKSSIIQPLLLLKQTLEVPYDPGPLLLDGPNVSITSIDQVLSFGIRESGNSEFFAIKVRTGDWPYTSLRFSKGEPSGIRLLDMTTQMVDRTATLSEDMSRQALTTQLAGSEFDRIIGRLGTAAFAGTEIAIIRDRWSLRISVGTDDEVRAGRVTITASAASFSDIERQVARIIHLPALRGNPQRTYKTAAVEDRFPGVFNDYTASVISTWQDKSAQDKLAELGSGLEKLGLSWTVTARQLDDASVELLVGRLPHRRRGSTRDLVNIADVGFGVSQTLPVVVALLAAAPNQLVYLEQPEIHLHPRAQVGFADLLAEAVDRGARVIVETHSSLLLRAIQTLVAQQRIAMSDVVLHWFSRDIETGYSTIRSAELDRSGTFGDWPEDFDEVNLSTDHAYLTAAESAEARPNEQDVAADRRRCVGRARGWRRDSPDVKDVTGVLTRHDDHLSPCR